MRIPLSSSAGFRNQTNFRDQATVIDCGTCVMRETDACADCVVTFLCRDDETSQTPAENTALVFDISEIRAMRALAEAGLVPTLRHRASG